MFLWPLSLHYNSEAFTGDENLQTLKEEKKTFRTANLNL